MSQGLTVLQNSVAPNAPDSNYRSLYPKADGWYEIDSAGNTYRLVNTNNAVLLAAANAFTNANTFTYTATPLNAIVQSDSDLTVAVINIRHRRATAGDPGATFGASIATYLEGKDGSDVLASYTAAYWIGAQTDDTTARDSAYQIVGMRDNVLYGSATFTPTNTSIRGSLSVLNSAALGADSTFYIQDRDTANSWAVYATSSALRFYYTSDHMTLTTTGTLTLAGGLNVGSATGAATGQIKSKYDGAFIRTDAITSTKGIYLDIRNGTGVAFVGTEGSAGGDTLLFTTAYCTFLASTASRDLFLGTSVSAIAAITAEGAFAVRSGASAPATRTGWAQIYIDAADGDLKVKFPNGTVKTIATD